MQRNVVKGAPEWVRTVPVWSEALAPRGPPGALRRPPHAAVAGQPAGRGVPRAVLPRRRRRSPTGLVLDLDPPEGADFDVVVAHGAARAAGAGRRGAGRRGEDQRRQGAARRRPGARTRRPRTRRPPPGRWPPAPSGWTPSWPPPPTSRTTGAAGCSSTRRGRGRATIVAAYSPRVRPGLPVSAPVPWDDAGRRPARRRHRADGGGAARRRATRGRPRCPSRRSCPPTWSPRGTPSPIARVAAMHEGRRAQARRGRGRHRTAPARSPQARRAVHRAVRDRRPVSVPPADAVPA